MNERPKLTRTIEPPENSMDVEDMVVPVCVDITVVTNSKLSEFPILDKVLNLAVKDALARFEKEGFRAFLHHGKVRPMSQDELLSILPRKVHFVPLPGEKHICDTAHVAKKNLTLDPDKVTCKLCLRKMNCDDEPTAGQAAPAPAPRPGPSNTASPK